MLQDVFIIKSQRGNKLDTKLKYQVPTSKTKIAELMATYCLRSRSPWCKLVLIAPVQAVQGRPGPSDTGPVPSEWILGGSWDGVGGGGEALKPEQCHVSEGPDSSKRDQRR